MKSLPPFPGQTRKKAAYAGKSVFLLLAWLLIGYGNSMAQRPISGGSNRTSDSTVEDRLVARALDGPQIRQMEHQGKINEYQLEIARRAPWINLLTLSVNYNDQSIKGNSGINQYAYVYPKYFFGLNIPLGTLFSKSQVKVAKEQIEVTRESEEQLKRTIKQQVLTAYRQYLSYGELIGIQTELVNDVKATLIQTEQKFKEGTVTAEAYTTAQRVKNDEMAKLINLQLQQDLVKLEIERMIGTSLESVIK